ncbi:MAG: Hpt domain-containing protein, partial [Bacillota bacterium]|nr:Hpt domain-containing protein [Bacillota bacterium]
MEFNDSNSIFQNEYKILENASNVLRDEDFKENPIRKQYEELLTGYKKLLQQSVRIVNISDKQQNFLYKLQSDLKNILDNTEQGIFTVNLDLIVNRGCSAECKRIFGQNIEGGNLISLIKPYNDSEKIKLIESILNKDFFDGDGLNRQVMLMLLPNELKVGERVYGVSYKPVNFDFKEQVENAFMIVMTDITEKKSIKSKMEEEQIIFKCITRIISDIKTFSMCIREYRNFYSVKLPEIINNSRKNVFDILNELFRTVHTLKGNFAIFEITWLVEFLDDVEQKMFLMRENHENLTIQDIKNALNSYDFDFALTNALNRLKAIIGNKWILDQEFAVIDIQELKAAEKKAAEFSRELEETLKKMRYSSLCEMLSIYPEYVQRLAGRLEKSIVPFN